ncbi:MAG: efflux RND transporter periplasmic adaptor subunit [Planctomycetes bacterium]|nr:efflux RND transporter periplasmic adaptor subunit [Planctomycetota bacterium]
MIKRIGAIVVVGLLLLAGLVYSQQRTGPLKVSGFVESDEIRVGSRVGGRVKAVLIEEGDEARPGQPLVELEPFQLLEQLAQARAELAQAEADANRYEAGYLPEEIEQSQARLDQWVASRDRLADREEDIASAQANLELAQAQLQLAKLKYDRTEALFGRNSASQQDMDQVNSELRVARATERVRQEELGKLKRSRPSDIKEAEARVEEARQEWLLRKNGYRQEDRARAQAAVAAARAAVAAFEKQVEELTIRAPVAGSIEAVDLRPGDLVGANTAAVSMIERGRLWIRSYVPESHLNIQVGNQVIVTTDSFPGRTFKAHITYISRQAEFTPGNVQTPEERSKQVFRVKVLLDEGHDLLRPGMVGDVIFETP